MDIEAVAATTPDHIFRESIDVLLGLAPFQARRLVEQLKVGAEAQQALPPLLRKLYDVFYDKDCTLLEINPLILTDAGIPWSSMSKWSSTIMPSSAILMW